eukprot:9704042-Alexandrium_andersonii.AAC.1
MYNDACDAAEKRLHISTTRDLQRLIGTLEYDKRERGARGRALVKDTFGLKRGDRLEPSPSCPDTGAGLDEMVVPDGGLDLVFWRTADQTMCVHRCPLFGPHTMLGPELLLVDEMHCLHLGVFATFILTVLWDLISANAFEAGQCHNEEALAQQSALRLRYELFSWYKACHFPNMHHVCALAMQRVPAAPSNDCHHGHGNRHHGRA